MIEFNYHIDQSKCTFCAGCASVCPVLAINVYDIKIEITEKCINCGNCKNFCPVSAIRKVEAEK